MMASSSNLAPAVDAPVLLRDDGGGICTLTLNRPRQFNALSEALIGALQDAFDVIARDRAVRVVVLAANGDGFCAGHDLKEMRAQPQQSHYEALFKKCSRMMLSIAAMPQPVIARVHGIATAAGCQLVAACDLAVASERARFATSGIGVGLFCMTPGVALARNVSRKQAFEMLFTGEFISAAQARDQGLVNRVVAPDQLDAAVADLSGAIVAKSAAAVGAGKRVLYRQMEMDAHTAYMYASEAMAQNTMLDDAREGIDAFLEKRTPTWRDR